MGNAKTILKTKGKKEKRSPLIRAVLYIVPHPVKCWGYAWPSLSLPQTRVQLCTGKQDWCYIMQSEMIREEEIKKKRETEGKWWMEDRHKSKVRAITWSCSSNMSGYYRNIRNCCYSIRNCCSSDNAGDVGREAEGVGKRGEGYRWGREGEVECSRGNKSYRSADLEPYESDVVDLNLKNMYYKN